MASAADGNDVEEVRALAELPFPPVTQAHIMRCSYHYWHPKYRKITPKARLIPLTHNFIHYLKSDGIILPPDDGAEGSAEPWDDHDSGIFSGTDADNPPEEDRQDDPSVNWRPLHESIQQTIRELGGKVAPKLNWSAPKDATWINPTNSMECRSANDVYMMLKSSDFINFDLDEVLDDTVDLDDTVNDSSLDISDGIPYHLVLRKYVNFNPSVEFRCFVRRYKVIGICQRDMNHFDFLAKMADDLRNLIEDFFEDHLRDTFPDENFVFDVYIPAPHEKVWLIDINPWAPRTDPILYSWLELLTLQCQEESDGLSEGIVRLHVQQTALKDSDPTSRLGDEADEFLPVEAFPEIRLIRKDDPEARNFNSPKYSAHKMPKDVVDAGQAGPGTMREFADQWKQAMARQAQPGDGSDADD